MERVYDTTAIRFQRPDGSAVSISGSDLTRNQAIERDKREHPQRWGITAQHTPEEIEMPLNITQDDFFNRSSDDDDDEDYSPPPTFNRAQYEAAEARKNGHRKPPAPIVNRDDDEDYSPPPTFNRAQYEANRR